MLELLAGWAAGAWATGAAQVAWLEDHGQSGIPACASQKTVMDSLACWFWGGNRFRPAGGRQ